MDETNCGKFSIEEYNPQWKNKFNVERSKLITLLGTKTQVEHIGSTSVTGLKARPIIDMMIGSSSKKHFDKCLKNLHKLGYISIGRLELEDKVYSFVKSKEPMRLPYQLEEGESLPPKVMEGLTHTLYLTEFNNTFWTGQLKLRNIINNDEAARLEFFKIKDKFAPKLSAKYSDYCQAKESFITNIQNQ